jgi:SAM-dependent methyltransferase
MLNARQRGLRWAVSDDEAVTLQQAGLLSAPGQELLELLSGEDVTPDRALRLASDLRARFPAELVAAALTQQTLRVAGRAKFRLADRMLFTRAGLEQASSDLTARHSATRLDGLRRVADLCCGIGGNLIALAEVVGADGQVLAVDADLQTLSYAVRNAGVYGLAERIRPLCADVRDLVLNAGRSPAVDAVYIDPARRASGRRLRPGDSQPPLDWCLGLAGQVPSVCIKAAPGLPRELAPPGWELEFVATGRQLKEALLWSPALAACERRATILPGGHCLTAVAGPSVEVRAPGAYLLDPNPAVTRAGLVEDLARMVGGWKIDPMIAFVALDREIVTPFARTLRVLESMPWHERTVARKLRELGIGTADIRRRGLAGDVEQIHRRLGLEGDASATIVITRREGQPWSLICAPVTSSSTTSP